MMDWLVIPAVAITAFLIATAVLRVGGALWPTRKAATA